MRNLTISIFSKLSINDATLYVSGYQYITQVTEQAYALRNLNTAMKIVNLPANAL